MRGDGAAARELAAKVAPFLGDTWRVELPDPDCDWADIVRDEDGARMRVTVGGWQLEGRASFRGMWPKYRDGKGYCGGKSTDITCDVKRAPASIAKDVLRRFLPAYEVVYAKALAYVTGHDRSMIEAELVAGRIAATIGGTAGVVKSSRYGDGVSISGEPDSIRKLTIHPAYGGVTRENPVSVSFEAHGLEPETAAAVLEIIKAAEQRRVESRVRVREESGEADLEEELEATNKRLARIR